MEGTENRPLPKWLTFNRTSGILEGVPSEQDTGEIYIKITAVNPKLKESVDDVFSVDVLPFSYFNGFQKDQVIIRYCFHAYSLSSLKFKSLILEISFSATAINAKILIKGALVSCYTIVCRKTFEDLNKQKINPKNHPKIKFVESFCRILNNKKKKISQKMV